MKLILIALMSLAFFTSSAQIRTRWTPVKNAFTETTSVKPSRQLSSLHNWLLPEAPRSYRFSKPILTHFTSHGLAATSSYWAGSMTTQSLRKGKMGTYYLWDVQGNLRESRFFLDVNRKNRYSFKIVVPRR